MATTSQNPMRHSMSSDFAAQAEAIMSDRMSATGSLVSVRRLNLHDRANSDTNLAHHALQQRSSLSVDRREVSLGSGESVIVSWDLHEPVSGSDWIGLFLLGKCGYTLSTGCML